VIELHRSRADHALNRRWLEEFYRLFGSAAAAKLSEGQHGEISFALIVRDGIVQSIEDRSITAYRQTAAAS
jgi:hypothetical protein